MTRDRAEMAAFLRDRRDRLTPAQAGITAFPGPRRVPGLRREELALLAGISPDYYSRLEQGRQTHVSQEVLDALARALRLDEVERAHLGDLAAPDSRHRAVGGAEMPQQPDPGLLRMMTALDHVPVLLLGWRAEVLARNGLLCTVLGSSLQPGTSFVRYLFQDPTARQRIVNWVDFASASVAAMRREAGRHPQDRRLFALVEELRSTDPDVAQWWDDHAVRDYASVAKRIAHPIAGPLSFDIEIVCAPNEPDQRLVVYTVQPDSATALMLPILASWDGSTPLPRQ